MDTSAIESKIKKFIKDEVEKALKSRTTVTPSSAPHPQSELAAIDKRLSQLERTHPGIGSGGDPEYFGQAAQLDLLELKLEVLTEVLEKSHPGLTQTIEDRSKEAETAEAAEEDTPAPDTLDDIDDILDEDGR